MVQKNPLGWQIFQKFLPTTEVERLWHDCHSWCSMNRTLFEKPNPYIQGRQNGSHWVWDRLDPASLYIPSVNTMGHSEALLDIARAWMGENAQFFKDKLILKPPGTPGYGAHQDATYWHGLAVDPNQFVTILVPLQQMSRNNGGLYFADQKLDRLLDETQLVQRFGQDEPEVTRFNKTYMDLQVGDILVFDGLAVHGSDWNRSKIARPSLFFSFAPARVGPLRETYYQNFHRQIQAERLQI